MVSKGIHYINRKYKKFKKIKNEILLKLIFINYNGIINLLYFFFNLIIIY